MICYIYEIAQKQTIFTFKQIFVLPILLLLKPFSATVPELGGGNISYYIIRKQEGSQAWQSHIVILEIDKKLDLNNNFWFLKENLLWIPFSLQTSKERKIISVRWKVVNGERLLQGSIINLVWKIKIHPHRRLCYVSTLALKVINPTPFGDNLLIDIEKKYIPRHFN